MTRPKPGIKNSLFGIVDFCHQVLDNVHTEGIKDGSLIATLDFSKSSPSTITTCNVDVTGLGSAWLLYLAVHPILLHASHITEVTIHGGTDVFFKKNRNQTHTMTPPTIYMRDVWFPNITTFISIGFNIDVNVIRDHRDKETYPYAIKMTRSESVSESKFIVHGLKKSDGCIKTVRSTESGLQVGTSHPFYDYKLTDPDSTLWCDEHFSDMIIPYIYHNKDHIKMQEYNTVSDHHKSAVYIATSMTLK
jgi:hypothetical protein